MNARIIKFSQEVQYAARLGAGAAAELRAHVDVSQHASIDELLDAADHIIARAALMVLNDGKPVPFGGVPMALVGARSEHITRWIDDADAAIRAAVAWSLVDLTAGLLAVDDFEGLEAM